eukprot:TRINITY_DN42411_c0_g1_i1.p1 TRINITY_DN42411_c0_g1~~TRINITY_DN42411_c0_g1_i1.p1  ORF type:complete len:492 (-),score=86.45 TRINITY_DN42411_c0_g1_i1:33-1508(-)
MGDPTQTQALGTLIMDDPLDFEDHSTSKAWGHLVSLNPQFPNLDIEEDSVTLGRVAEGNLFAYPFQQISGKHMCLYRETVNNEEVYYVKDTSMNGTFVNGKKIGKGQIKVVKPGDEISLAVANSVTAKSALKANPTTPFVAFLLNIVDAPEEDDSGFFSGYYKLEKLGDGHFATVFRCCCKKTGEYFAVKEVDKSKLKESNLREDQLMDEVRILQKLQHPNIVGITEVFESTEKLYVVMELVHGGDLFDRIVNGNPPRYSEGDAKLVMRGLMSAIHFIHKHDYAHRDLKPENILLSTAESNTDIKVGDFGLARLVNDQKRMSTVCGTPNYVAPEVMTKGPEGYTVAVDIWSCGVILFTLIAGQLPFSAGYCKIKFEGSVWKDVAQECKDLIIQMLDGEPDKRPSAANCLKSAWLCDGKESVTTMEPPKPKKFTALPPSVKDEPVKTPKVDPIQPVEESSTSSDAVTASFSSGLASKSIYEQPAKRKRKNNK